jgi:hypothetical protein
MPACLKKKFRRWAATVLVALYAFGVLGPAAAFARANTTSIIHVLSEAHGGFLTPHFHNDGRDHDHGHDQSNKRGHAHQCCGATSIAGLEVGAAISLIPLTLASAVAWPSEQRASAHKLDRLDRPPRDFLPL